MPAFSYRLNQGYFVSQYAAHELRRDPNKKYRLDERVENDVLRRVQAGCDDAKRVRSQYINLSKRYANDADQYEMYINVSRFTSLINFYRKLNKSISQLVKG